MKSITEKIESVLFNYRKQRDHMASTSQSEEHPNGDFIVNTHLCGKSFLQYIALMNIADEAGYTTQDMLKRIIERGIVNELTLWRKATKERFLNKIIGDKSG